MIEIAKIRKAGVTLELVSDWGPWSPCENCKFSKGYKTSRGFCRIKSKFNEVLNIFFSYVKFFFIEKNSLY